MLVGIKYCGGCRSGFPLKNEADCVIRDVLGFSDSAGQAAFSFVAAERGVRYDVLLAVCGCKTCCPDLGGYAFDRVIYVDESGRGAVAAKDILGSAD